MARPLCAYIDLAALQHNFLQIKSLVGSAKVMAVVKANAYGHGIERIAQHLAAADAFAVASIDEALSLRSVGITQPIVLLEGIFKADELRLVVAHQLTMVVHAWHQIEWLKSAHLAAPIHVWMKVDTGMHRLGFSPQEALKAWQTLQSMSAVQQPIGLISHFANSDEPLDNQNVNQQYVFAQLVDQLQAEKIPKSFANSAAVLHFPESHLDWVRPGLMLYGVYPSAYAHSLIDLKPVMTLMTEVIAIKTVDAGETVGYGGFWRADKQRMIAIAAAGYGDGYPRHLQQPVDVLVHGQRLPVVGRVSMDMLAIDITDSHHAVAIGDVVTLWGKGLPVSEVAAAANTISYELLCGVTKRVRAIESAP